MPSSSFSSIVSRAKISVTAGVPRVMVPVLSRTTVSIFPACSRCSPPLISIPLAAPTPVPTMIAAGVASPRAQGQATTRTVTMCIKELSKPAPLRYQPPKVSRETAIIAGTKTAATLSASRWMGALEPCASSTRRIIWARTVSCPTFVARKVKLPKLLIEAPTTSSPGFFSTGMLSPVRWDSSMLVCPSMMTPSTGTLSPGRTTTRSPTATSSAGMSISTPPRITRAVFDCSCTSFSMASEVLPRARASSSLPSKITVMSMAADSK